MDGPDDERLRFSRHVTGTSLFPAARSAPGHSSREVPNGSLSKNSRHGRRTVPSNGATHSAYSVIRSRSGCPPEEDDAIGGRPYGRGDPNRAALTPYACSAPAAYRSSPGTSGFDRARRPQASGSALSRSGLRNDVTGLMFVFILKSRIESTVSCIESRD